MLFNNKVYNIIKHLVQVGMPAAATLYLVLADTWELPNAAEVAATITGVATFLGVLLGFSTRQYNKSSLRFDGEMVVEPDEDGNTIYGLVLNEDPEVLQTKKEVVFNVKK